jgi:hypothetical protein
MGLWGEPTPRLLQMCDRDAVISLKLDDEKLSKQWYPFDYSWYNCDESIIYILFLEN